MWRVDGPPAPIFGDACDHCALSKYTPRPPNLNDSLHGSGLRHVKLWEGPWSRRDPCRSPQGNIFQNDKGGQHFLLYHTYVGSKLISTNLATASGKQPQKMVLAPQCHQPLCIQKPPHSRKRLPPFIARWVLGPPGCIKLLKNSMHKHNITRSGSLTDRNAPQVSSCLVRDDGEGTSIHSSKLGGDGNISAEIRSPVCGGSITMMRKCLEKAKLDEAARSSSNKAFPPKTRFAR